LHKYTQSCFTLYCITPAQYLGYTNLFSFVCERAFLACVNRAQISSCNQPVLSDEGKILAWANSGSFWCVLTSWLTDDESDTLPTVPFLCHPFKLEIQETQGYSKTNIFHQTDKLNTDNQPINHKVWVNFTKCWRLMLNFNKFTVQGIIVFSFKPGTIHKSFTSSSKCHANTCSKSD